MQEELIKQIDIRLAISEYLSDKTHLIDKQKDYVNISDGLIHSWHYKNIEIPSNELLLQLNTIAMVKLAQEISNKEAEIYLKSTDWYVIRMMDSGIPIPSNIQILRQAARDSIVRQL